MTVTYAFHPLVGQSVLEGGTDEHELAARLEAVSKMLLPLTGPWLEHVFALHLREALRQDVVTAEQMATGRTNASIAQTLYMSERSVEKHISAVFLKLGLDEEGESNRRVMAVLAFVESTR